MTSDPALDLTRLRRRLHTLAELSGQEAETAAFVAGELAALGPGELITGLGGHGVAAVFQGARPGPRVLLRAELDALPIDETLDLDHASFTPGVAHKCGHDGHLAILLGLARKLAATPPAAGRCILLAQPAEETGAGAEAVAVDPRFAPLRPDWVFALHNLPGYAAGTVLVREGAFTAASAGLMIELTGATSHAAYPERGRSPDRALAELLLELVNLPDRWRREGRLALVTVVHSVLGERAFGVAPGKAKLAATLRADRDEVLDGMLAAAVEAAGRIAAEYHLACATSVRDRFPATVNDPRAVELVRAAAHGLGLTVLSPAESPFRWSEDFGRLAELGRGALIGIGAGEDHPGLHAEDYDFPDGLLAPGVALLERVVRLASRRDSFAE